MNERWVCKRCFADNESTVGACQRCGLTRGAESSNEDRASWAAQAGAATPGAPAKSPAWQQLLRFWWIPAIVIVLAVGYFATARRGGGGEIESAGTVSVNDLRAGDCFNTEETELTEVDGVPCTVAHEYEVFHVADHQAATFPTDAEMSQIQTTLCDPVFETYVGEPYATSAIYANMITPSAETWADGDREFICVLYDPSDTTLTSSLRGANR